MTELSILIVNWNTRDFLRDCLHSIRTFPPTRPYEVIVVDNASGDGSATMTAAEFPSVKLIANSDNAGYAHGNNQALAESSGEWLLLLNPDTKAVKGTFDSAIETAASLKNFGALGVKQIGSDGQVQRSVRSFPEPSGVFWELFKFSTLLPQSRYFGAYRMTWFDYSGTVEVDQPMATFLLTTREVYDEIGGMDERFPIFFNDVDWCYRIKESGRSVYYTDRASIIHYGGAGTGQINRSRMAAESKKSFIKFYEKHYKQKLPRLVYNAICSLVLATMYLQRSKSK